MSIFKFKEFSIAQDRCAQKIGTDGVLLAAWASPSLKPFSILDIGAGTGVIALILAQRYGNAQIDAIELDDDAHGQCMDNFENSPWADRLFCYHAAFQEFYEEVEDRYDLIVSNPPFYESSNIKEIDTMSPSRQQARFDNALPFEELLYGVYKLLEDTGTFACIIPYDREDAFLKIAAHFQLVPASIAHVKGTATSVVKRSLLALRFRESENHTNPIPTTLIIEHDRHIYTDAYQTLVKDFYLNM